MPSIDQVLPWLHLLFDAYDDYKRQRERDAFEAAEREATTQLALAEQDHDEILFDDGEDDEDRDRKRKKKDKKDKKRRKKDRK